MTEFLASINYSQWILHVLVLLPLAGAVPVLLGDERSARRMALVVTSLVFLLSAGLWWAFDAHDGGMQFVSSAPWIPRWGISYRVGIDGISLFMVLLTTAMMPLSVLASWWQIDRSQRAFYALMLALSTGLIGVFIALDLVVFYVFFEVMLIPMYFIIGIWGGTNRLYAAIKFFIYTMAGSLLMLVAIVVMAWKIADTTGTLSFAYQHLLENAGSLGSLAPWLFAAFALAFAIKVPIFPLHTWLPDAHVEAPTAGSVLLAAIMLKIGTYGFLRF
ncbi:MAG TPA: NADH-quinone oxidoreductase subunit M, partial [Gemmatimonadales bacterium]|nr:NADH-quinone oxidoreductase subunit M [Gemmatimonadales bacterium]